MQKNNNIQKPLEDILEIVLITYNRHKELSRTLQECFAEYSPVRNCQFTILDNSSTDGTSDLCQEYEKQYKNVCHIRHKKNIGGNANICRAFEIASSEYVWVIADDDFIDWTGWQEIEDALCAGYDCIFTTLLNLRRSDGPGGILMESTFCPACIHKTANITSDVLQGMYANIHNFLPHVTISIAILQNSGKFYIPKNEIIYQPSKLEHIPEYATMDTTKGNKINYSAFTKNKFWEVGLITMLSVLETKKQNMIYADISKIYGDSREYIKYIINNYASNNFSTRNLFDIYWGFPDQCKSILINTLFEYFLISPTSRSPINLSEWNMLIIDAIAQHKRMIVSNKVKLFLKKLCIRFLRQLK